MVVRAAATAVLLVLAAGGCSAVQESLACPGDHCPAELRSVADATADLDGVTSVDRTWRFYNLDHGHSGGVDVHASVTTREQARALAHTISGIYADSKVEPVDTVSVVVVPEPERAAPDRAETVLGGEAPADVGCAPDRCATEVEEFEDAFAAAPVADDASLGRVGWGSGSGSPETVVEVSAATDPMDAAALREFENRVLDVAESTGLTDIGDVRVLIHYQRRVEFSFAFRQDN